jgi:hypothetical protein
MRTENESRGLTKSGKKEIMVTGTFSRISPILSQLFRKRRGQNLNHLLDGPWEE